MVLDGAFAALFLLVSGASAVTVLPPINVTVSCKNFTVTVSWEYPEQQPPTIFRMNIRSSAGDLVRETTHHQFDLSDIIWASQERYMGFYHVSVTAIQGGIQSEAGAADSFSFNELKTSDIKCKLVFPPANLIETDLGAILKFKNPLLAYEKLKRTLEVDDAFFSVSVISNDGEILKVCDKQNIDRDDCDSCTLRDEICKHNIPFAKGTKKCVRLKGRLFDKGYVGQVLFRETDSICAAAKQYEAPVVLLVTLLSITALVISLLTVFICKAKAWTMETHESLPKILLPNHWRGDFKVVDACDPDISPARPTVSKTCKTPSVSSEEEEHDPADHCDEGSGSVSVSQPSACFYTDGWNLETSSQELKPSESLSKGNGTDDESADDSVKTECVSICLEEEVEEKESSYDRPHTHQVDKPDKDTVTAHGEE